MLWSYLFGEQSIGYFVIDWINEYRLLSGYRYIGEKSGFFIMEAINFTAIVALIGCLKFM
jgi:hypothetical protein